MGRIVYVCKGLLMQGLLLKDSPHHCYAPHFVGFFGVPNKCCSPDVLLFGDPCCLLFGVQVVVPSIFTSQKSGCRRLVAKFLFFLLVKSRSEFFHCLSVHPREDHSSIFPFVVYDPHNDATVSRDIKAFPLVFLGQKCNAVVDTRQWRLYRGMVVPNNPKFDI